jgi:hypothetical protein
MEYASQGRKFELVIDRAKTLVVSVPPTYSQLPTRRSNEASDVRFWHKADIIKQNFSNV